MSFKQVGTCLQASFLINFPRQEFIKLRGLTMNSYIHKVGKRREPEISFHATAENFLAGCRFNDSLRALSTDGKIHIPKGVYFFRTHQEADRQLEENVVKSISGTTRR